ncbi:MAG: hypothetical protein ABSF28_26490 [Terracidiphilus sp.]|jgi:hypothetical protein
MFEIGQHVLVIPQSGPPYDATILARAIGDNGPGAYKVSLHAHALESQGQWHKACDVFTPEKSDEEDEAESSIDSFLRPHPEDELPPSL